MSQRTMASVNKQSSWRHDGIDPSNFPEEDSAPERKEQNSISTDAAKKKNSKSLADISGNLSPGRHIGAENDKRMVIAQGSTDLPDDGCGFDPECPMDYSIDDVKNRAFTAIQQKDQIRAKLEEVHASSRQACLAS